MDLELKKKKVEYEKARVARIEMELRKDIMLEDIRRMDENIAIQQQKEHELLDIIKEMEE